MCAHQWSDMSYVFQTWLGLKFEWRNVQGGRAQVLPHSATSHSFCQVLFFRHVNSTLMSNWRAVGSHIAERSAWDPWLRRGRAGNAVRTP